MKKIIYILLTSILLLTACGNTETMKPEAEMDADNSVLNPISITDNDAIYEFINETFPNQYTEEDFDCWTPFYMDIMKNGNNEVVYTAIYGDGKLEQAIFITGDNGKYEIIPSDINLAKYLNDVRYQDDFIVFTQKSGGSGSATKIDNLYVFNDDKIVYTGACLLIEEHASFPPEVNLETTGITTFNKGDSYSNGFTHEVITTGTEERYEKKEYQYKSETYQFTITDISESTESNRNVYIGKNIKPGDKVSKYFTVKEFDSGTMGDESLTFTLKGNDFVSGTLSAISEEEAYIYYFFEFDNPIFDKNILVEDNTNPNGEIEIDTTQEMKDFFIDINDLNLGEDTLLYLLNGGELKAEGLVKEIYYNSTPMDTSLYTTITEFKISDSELEKVYGTTKTKGLDFENETLYSLDEEVYIDYSQYELVVVPQQNTVNEMTTVPMKVVFSEEKATRSLVTILGEINDVFLVYTPNALDDSIVPKEKYIGTVKDTRLFVDAYMETDFASILLIGTFEDSNNNIYDISLSLDDCRDPESYEIILK